MRYVISLLLTCTIACVRASEAASIQKLLHCNFRNIDVASACDFEQEMKFYSETLDAENNYETVPTLNHWAIPQYNYPNIHPYYRYIVDTIAKLPVLSVCDVGAGSGNISKYIYAQNKNMLITCIEHNNVHLRLMHENFETKTQIIPPDLKVKANIVKGALPFLGFLEDNSFDLVFTCTVMMHLPYIPAVFSAKELARITSKYILHIENKNVGLKWCDRAIIKPSKKMSNLNYQAIDYKRIYETLGFKTVRYFEFKDPNTPATYIYYLGEKV